MDPCAGKFDGFQDCCLAMRYAILSDIHSNLEALKAVLAACRKANIDTFLCLGDIVGYGANPNECIELVQEYKMVCVVGNHDWAVSGKWDLGYFVEAARDAIVWTREHLVFNHFAYLDTLPPLFCGEDCILVHGNLADPLNFDYIEKREDAAKTFYRMDRQVCFIGHTHIPKIFVEEERDILRLSAPQFSLVPGKKYLVNAGSVGQPRDGNPQAAFCIFDTDARAVEICRVPYDIRAAQEKIREAGLPESLAERLSVGK